MRRNLSILCLLPAVGLVLALALPAEASFISDILAQGENSFEDQDREAFIDASGDGLFGVGDVLVGFVRLDDKFPVVDGVGAIDNRIYAIFTQQVSAVTAIAPALGIYQIDFVPTTVAGYALSDLVAGAPADGMIAVYSGTTAITDLILSSPGDVNGDLTTNLFDYFAAIQAGLDLTLIAGFGSEVSQADDYFTALTSGTIAGNLITGSVAGIPLIPQSTQIAQFQAGLSILFNADANVVYNELVFGDNPAIPGVTLHELVIANGAVRGSAGATNAAEWGSVNGNPGGFITDADFFVNVNVVPEPASMLAWAGLAGIAGIYGARRRRKLA